MRGPEPVASEDNVLVHDADIIVSKGGDPESLKGKYNRHTRRKLKAKQRQQAKRDKRQ